MAKEQNDETEEDAEEQALKKPSRMKDIYKKTRLAGDVVNLGAARKAKQEAEDAAKKEATKGVLKRVLEMPDK